MRVVFIHGPAASGKYTIGRALSEATGLPLFHNHLTVDLLLSLFPFGSPEFVGLRERIWLECFEAAARSGRSFIFTFTPEATVDPAFVGRAVEHIEAHGGRVLFVELTCNGAALEERLDSPSRREFGKLTSLVRYQELRRQGAFEFPPLPEPLVRVPTDRLSPWEAVSMIVAALPGG